jgi:hypothetical protein
LRLDQRNTKALAHTGQAQTIKRPVQISHCRLWITQHVPILIREHHAAIVQVQTPQQGVKINTAMLCRSQRVNVHHGVRMIFLELRKGQQLFGIALPARIALVGRDHPNDEPILWQPQPPPGRRFVTRLEHINVNAMWHVPHIVNPCGAQLRCSKLGVGQDRVRALKPFQDQVRDRRLVNRRPGHPLPSVLARQFAVMLRDPHIHQADVQIGLE